MHTLLAVWLCLATPTLDAFDAPLDPQRWYIGSAQQPKQGVLRLQKSCWLVSRGIPDETLERIEIAFKNKRATLVVGFHEANEPLSGPVGELLRVKRDKREARLLVFTREGAQLDGAPIDWKGPLRGTFRIEADRGDLFLDEVRVVPRRPPPRELTYLEKRSVHYATTPPKFRSGEELFERQTMLLWDAEVAFLFRRAAES